MKCKVKEVVVDTPVEEKQREAKGNMETDHGGRPEEQRTDPQDRPHNRLVGVVDKASASRTEDPRFESCLRQDFLRGQVIPVT